MAALGSTCPAPAPAITVHKHFKSGTQLVSKCVWPFVWLINRRLDSVCVRTSRLATDMRPAADSQLKFPSESRLPRVSLSDGCVQCAHELALWRFKLHRAARGIF